MLRFLIALQFLMTCFLPLAASPVQLGIDLLLTPPYINRLKNKKIGLVTNQTAVNKKLQSTFDLLRQKERDWEIVALFAPEHGFYGRDYAEENISEESLKGIPIYTLYGNTRRPTKEMLEGIDLLIYDIQDIGCRSYTYITTLFYVMEAAAKEKIPVFVLDRPNPINGLMVDGPMLEDSLRSMVGYINIPYCYGMTIGELANYFNQEYGIKCQLDVIPMKGWLRSMSFQQTGLSWIPTSPHIPESNTPLYYPITGILGELGVVNIGIGYTLPFKIIGAPWIDGPQFAKALNDMHYTGVSFSPFYFRPFYGKYKGENCQGVLISVHNAMKYKPLSIQYLLIETLRKLYPREFNEKLKENKSRKEMFCKVFGSKEAWNLIHAKNHLAATLRAMHQKERNQFFEKRKLYLNPAYAGSKN